MFNNFLLICSLCLVFVSVHCEPDSADCPDPKSIEPCHCDREGISCFNSLDEQKLSQVFKVPNGYNAYRSVWITQNSIYNLTRNIFNGLRIQSFFIEENEIETVEEGAFTGSYEIVKQISLHRNKIKSFPFNELGLMEQLESLTLSHNKLTIIPANSFSLATKLTQIDLSNNEIETLEPGAFFGMRNLQLILLGNNKLTQLPALSFGSNLLFTLDVSNNVINSIDRSTFLNAVPAIIELSYNQLTFLDPNIFENLVRSYNTKIGIGGNPLTCRGCTKYKWLLSTSEEFIVDFQCANGRTLSDLNLLNIGCIF